MKTLPFNASGYAGTKVRVYRNLHTGTMSVQCKINGRWKVVAHTRDIRLERVIFKVSEATRRKVIKSGRKSVHAYIYGVVTDFLDTEESLTPIRYNPYDHGYFHRLDEHPVYAASVCLIRNCKPAIR